MKQSSRASESLNMRWTTQSSVRSFKPLQSEGLDSCHGFNLVCVGYKGVEITPDNHMYRTVWYAWKRSYLLTGNVITSAFYRASYRLFPSTSGATWVGTCRGLKPSRQCSCRPTHRILHYMPGPEQNTIISEARLHDTNTSKGSARHRAATASLSRILILL